MYQRNIHSIRRDPPTYPQVPDKYLEQWLVSQAQQYGLHWLLAHDDEGVIWGKFIADKLPIIRKVVGAYGPNCILGKFIAGKLHTSRNITLNPTSLQQCRIFGQRGELLIWRGPRNGHGQVASGDVDHLSARLFLDGDSSSDKGEVSECIDEDHWLWGWGNTRDVQGIFIKLTEGTQGITHAPPLSKTPTETQRAALHVRHYLAQDDATGMFQIVASRLVQVVEPDV